MRFEIHKYEDRQFYFNLHFPNGQIVTSETYQTKRGAKRGIKVMKRNIFCAKVEDLTIRN